MTLTREERIELVEDLLTRMVERGLLLTVQDIHDEINVTCSGQIDCPHDRSEVCGCDTDDIVRSVDELKDRVMQLEDFVQTHHWIVKTPAPA